MSINETDSKHSKSTIPWKNSLMILGIFVAGLVTGVVTQHLNKAQPPRGPAGLGMKPPHLKEFPGKDGPFSPGFHKGNHEDREHRHFGEQRREMPPRIKEYAEKMKAVVEPYKTKIEAVLTSEQKEKWVQERGAQAPEGMPSGPEPRQAGPGFRGKDPRGGGHEPLMGLVIYKPSLDRMSEKLALDSRQKAQIEKIMMERRDAVLKFVDQNPFPRPGHKSGKEA